MNSEKVQQRVRQVIAGFRSADLAAAQAACDRAAVGEREALAILQEPIRPEDPHGHDDARAKLATIRESKRQAESGLRAARAAADAEIAAALQPLHSEIWRSVEQSVAALSAAVVAAEELKNAAGGAAAGMFFGGLDALTGIRVRLEAIERDWTNWKGGRR